MTNFIFIIIWWLKGKEFGSYQCQNNDRGECQNKCFVYIITLSLIIGDL